MRTKTLIIGAVALALTLGAASFANAQMMGGYGGYGMGGYGGYGMMSGYGGYGHMGYGNGYGYGPHMRGYDDQNDDQQTRGPAYDRRGYQGRWQSDE